MNSDIAGSKAHRIVAVSAEGAALFYRTICVEGAKVGHPAHPDELVYADSPLPTLDSTRILARAALREVACDAAA